MDIYRELRQAARALRTTPGITVASIVILALGIGASTTEPRVIKKILEHLKNKANAGRAPPHPPTKTSA